MTIAPQTQNLMRLLSQVILADGHIHKTEIQALVVSVTKLGLSDEDGHALTPAAIRNWFDSYLGELNAVWSEEPKDITLTKLILSLADWPEKQAVVDALEAISLSDADYHKEEKRLMSLVKTFWQYDGLDALGSRIEG